MRLKDHLDSMGAGIWHIQSLPGFSNYFTMEGAPSTPIMHSFEFLLAKYFITEISSDLAVS